MDKLRANELRECLNFVYMWVITWHVESGTHAEGSGENDVQDFFNVCHSEMFDTYINIQRYISQT